MTADRAVVAVVGGIGATTAVLRRYAALVEEHAGLPTRVIASDYGLHDLPAGTSAVRLVRATPDREQKARDTVTGIPVLTDLDTTAIALTAALLTTLGRARDPCWTWRSPTPSVVTTRRRATRSCEVTRAVHLIRLATAEPRRSASRVAPAGIDQGGSAP